MISPTRSSRLLDQMISTTPHVQNGRSSHRHLLILGTRGIPAAHGGFETFAERLALHMVSRGWRVTVYCQIEDTPKRAYIDYWRGIRRVNIQTKTGALGTVKFDLEAVRHARHEQGVTLVLGYNTAIFSAFLRLYGKPLLTNMDGIEWKRAKWPLHARAWLLANEWIGAATSSRLIADHPEIARHLGRLRSPEDITMIPYGADTVSTAPEDFVRSLGLMPSSYIISIGRCEPENNILTMVRAYAEKQRPFHFVCLAKLEPSRNSYHRAVLDAGLDRVHFPGAIYDQERVKALRFHAAAYCHGHTVGGTNPSLVEALGAGNAVIAHDNNYNRWVAGEGQFYFSDQRSCANLLDQISQDPEILKEARNASRQRFDDSFRWGAILDAYEGLCDSALSGASVDQSSCATNVEAHT
jgi:glycosyltransferase involved in cell wall biosynthesis